MWYTGTLPGPNLQALDKGERNSSFLFLWPLWGVSRPGTGVHGGAGRGKSDGQIRCGPGEPKSMLVGPELKALRSPDKRCCKLKSGCSGVHFTLALAPASSLPQEGTVGAVGWRGGVGRRGGGAVMGTGWQFHVDREVKRQGMGREHTGVTMTIY